MLASEKQFPPKLLKTLKTERERWVFGVPERGCKARITCFALRFPHDKYTVRCIAPSGQFVLRLRQQIRVGDA